MEGKGAPGEDRAVSHPGSEASLAPPESKHPFAGWSSNNKTTRLAGHAKK